MAFLWLIHVGLLTIYLLGAHPPSRCPQVFDDERALDIGGCFSEGTRGKAIPLTAVSNLSL